MRLTQAQADMISARKQPKKASAASFRARPRPTHTPGQMNKTEALFESEFIKPRLFCGEFVDHGFESIKLRLANNTFYTPDFHVVTPTEFIFYEVKGYWEDDARVKIKVAADKYPFFRFIAVQKTTKKQGGTWRFEEIKPA